VNLSLSLSLCGALSKGKHKYTEIGHLSFKESGERLHYVVPLLEGNRHFAGGDRGGGGYFYFSTADILKFTKSSSTWLTLTYISSAMIRWGISSFIE
jgi:hypothetical protein